MDELEADYGNVRAAVEWSRHGRSVRRDALLSGMLDLFIMLGQADGLRLAEQLLERCSLRDSNRVDVQISAGALEWFTGDSDGARRTLAEARRLSRKSASGHSKGGPDLRGLLRLFGGSVERARDHSRKLGGCIANWG